MLHGSPPNRSGKLRRGIVYQYRAADAYQLTDQLWDDGGLVVRGKAQSTVRCETAVWQLPRHKDRIGQYGSAWNQIGIKAKQWNEDQGKISNPNPRNQF